MAFEKTRLTPRAGISAKEAPMWGLDEWKDVAEVVKNFAETALAIVAAIALLTWNARRQRNDNRP
jgi:hypothetical protein